MSTHTISEIGGMNRRAKGFSEEADSSWTRVGLGQGLELDR